MIQGLGAGTINFSFTYPFIQEPFISLPLCARGFARSLGYVGGERHTPSLKDLKGRRHL